MVVRSLVLVVLSVACVGTGIFMGFADVKSSFIMHCMAQNGHLNPGPCESYFKQMLENFEPIQKSRELDEFAKKIRERNKDL